MRNRFLGVQVLLCLIIVLPGMSFAQNPRPNAGTRPNYPMFNNVPSRSEVIGQNGMAATSQPLASQTAIDILKQGGNAIDAAIAANAVLALAEPTGCGLGGDIFILVWIASEKKLYGLNGSGRSPQDLTLEYFQSQGLTSIPKHGPLPVSVPGCVDGWLEVHNRFGKLPLDSVLAPAIHYARAGIPITEIISYYWELNARSLSSFPHFQEVFMPNGHTPKTGELFSNPFLANSLDSIARNGRSSFYEGWMAQKMVDAVQSQGGFLSLADLAQHHSEWVEPLSVSYHGYDIWELPPNGQGLAALQMLNILENFDLSKGPDAQYYHLLIEAKKLAFEDRAKYYSDPEFNELPLSWLLSKEYAQQRAALIDPDKARNDFQAGMPETDNTIYLTTADQYGNMVSLIQSNYRGMGSGVIPDSLGYILQDRGELFSLQEGHFNVFEPGKRPFHTIIPGFVTKNGEAYMSFGVMGGDMQPQGHVQVLNNYLLFGMNLQEAGDAPRLRHSGGSTPTGNFGEHKVYLETGHSSSLFKILNEKGHTLETESIGGFGGYQAIRFDPESKVYFGASEKRKDGQVIAY